MKKITTAMIFLCALSGRLMYSMEEDLCRLGVYLVCKGKMKPDQALRSLRLMQELDRLKTSDQGSERVRALEASKNKKSKTSKKQEKDKSARKKKTSKRSSIKSKKVKR